MSQNKNGIRKQIIIFFVLALSCFSVVIFLILSALNVFQNIPSEMMVSEGVCVDFVPNQGSGEEVYVVSYKCDGLVRFGEQGASTLERFQDHDYIDSAVTMECPIFAIENYDPLTFQVNKNEVCKYFAHENAEPSRMEISIDRFGEISTKRPTTE